MIKTSKNTSSNQTKVSYLFPLLFLIRKFLFPVNFFIESFKIQLILINIFSLILLIIATILFLIDLETSGFIILLSGFLLTIIVEDLHFKKHRISYFKTKNQLTIVGLFSIFSPPLLLIGLLNQESIYFPWLILLSFWSTIFYSIRRNSLFSKTNPKKYTNNWMSKIFLSQLIINDEIRQQSKFSSILFFIQMNISSNYGIIFFSSLTLFLFYKNLSVLLLTIMIITQLSLSVFLTLGFLFFKRSIENE